MRQCHLLIKSDGTVAPEKCGDGAGSLRCHLSEEGVGAVTGAIMAKRQPETACRMRGKTSQQLPKLDLTDELAQHCHDRRRPDLEAVGLE